VILRNADPRLFILQFRSECLSSKRLEYAERWLDIGGDTRHRGIATGRTRVGGSRSMRTWGNDRGYRTAFCEAKVSRKEGRKWIEDGKEGTRQAFGCAPQDPPLGSPADSTLLQPPPRRPICIHRPIKNDFITRFPITALSKPAQHALADY
jgi:hypothetical protein